MIYHNLGIVSILISLLPDIDCRRKIEYLPRSSLQRGPSGSLHLLLPMNVTEREAGKHDKNTPCCQDTLGTGVCKSMYRRNPDRFVQQCRINPDLSFIQCCMSCHFAHDIERKTLDGRYIESGEAMYDYDVERMLQSKYAQCEDRRTARFCEALVTQKIQEKSNTRVTNIWRRMPTGYKDLRSLIGGIDMLRDAPCESSALAFRVCRKTCGYCATSRSKAVVKFNAYTARNPNMCQTLYQ